MKFQIKLRFGNLLHVSISLHWAKYGFLKQGKKRKYFDKNLKTIKS